MTTITREHRVSPSVADIDRDVRAMSDSAVDRLANEFEPGIFSHKWELLTDRERTIIRAANEQARRHLEAKRKAEKDEQEKRAQEALAAYHQQQIDAYQEQMRAHWIGTAEQFTAAWPRMLEDWQIEQARAQNDDMLRRVRSVVEF
jgi:hypothetical protein